MNNAKESKFLSWLTLIGLPMYEENFSQIDTMTWIYLQWWMMEKTTRFVKY